MNASGTSGDLLFWGTKGYQAEADQPLTAQEMLKKSGLDWDVELRDIFVASDSQFGHYTKGIRQHRKAIVRIDNEDILGIGKSRYNCFSNREVFSFLDDLTDSGEALYEAAWAWRGGETVGLIMQLPEPVMIAGFDPHKAYILARTSHDGGGSLTITAQLGRTGCTNQVMAKIARAERVWRTTHSTTLEGKVLMARHALEMVFNYTSAWDEEVQRMLETTIAEDRFKEIARELFGEKHALPAVELWLGSPNLENIRTTTYGAYNGLTEYAQHVQPRSASLESRLTGGIARRTARAFELVTA